MTEENITVSDNSDSDEGGTQELRGHLSKWTNYIHGWQDRFIVLKDSTLSYYKSELESNLGCRGALCLKKAKVKPHEFDDCRFDVSVNDCVWYLRASNPEEKQQWIDVLESFKVESGYGTSSDSSSNGGGLRRHGSATSLQSTGSHVWKRAFWAFDGTRTPSPTEVRSRADSAESDGRTARRLTEKIQELDTYTELLSKQAVQLQQYFDTCVASYPQIDEGVEADAIDAVKLADGNDLSLQAGEVRATSASFRATIGATMATLNHCAELLRRREKQARQAEELYVALKNQLTEARLASKPGPDHEEGPHSTLPDDEFYDAVETGFDKMEEERCARVVSPSVHTRDQVELPPPAIDNRLTVHPLWQEIDRISTEQIQAAFEGVGGEIGWQLFAEEGDMRMYRREMEVDGMVMDPLKAMHKVRGVSAREMCHYFFNPRYRYEWETTLENMTIVEEISSDALVFHQTFKRIWPASQRDALFWSHVRAANDNTYAVTNHSTTNADYPHYGTYRDWLLEPSYISEDQGKGKTDTVSLDSSASTAVLQLLFDNGGCNVVEIYDGSKNQSRMIAGISSEALVFQHSFNFIWPATMYAVTNHSTTKADNPSNTGACIRLFVTVCLACRSSFPPGAAPTRDNITTSIAYCSTVNPGGWAPAGVLRAVYKREYPKFLKRFTSYVVEQCRDKPLAI